MAVTQVAERTLEDHPVDKNRPLVMELHISDAPMYDSLYHFMREDVSASVVFYFDEEITEKYQFSADTSPDDANRATEGQCLICDSGEGSHFKCGVWHKHNNETRLRQICEGCLGSFLEIRDELLSDYSGEIISEEL